MKKSVLVVGAIVVLAVAYVGASWYVGKRAEALVRQVVQADNQQIRQVLGAHGTSATLSVASYRRGVFSSDAVYALSVRDARGAVAEFKLADHIEHGPFPLSRVEKGKLRPLMV
ncbi:MAG: DUF945 family protein, partial [Candidimonas sp.]